MLLLNVPLSLNLALGGLWSSRQGGAAVASLAGEPIEWRANPVEVYELLWHSAVGNQPIEGV
jgi:hypothetical protein